MNDKLNVEQIQAVMHREGPCIVSACPGSGKTKVVTHRAATMLAEGIPGRSMLLITFTNKAAKEMKARLIQLCEANKISGAEDVVISTFHALCAKLIRFGVIPNGLCENFTILDEDQALHLMSEVADEHGLDRDDAKNLHYIYASWRETKDGWLGQYISDTFRDQTEVDIISAYESAMKASNATDFAGLIRDVARAMSTSEETVKRLSNRFKYVVVDEAQDTNDAQFHIATRIASHGNIMIVGDADQAIYEWRGAKPDNMFNMQKNMDNCRLIRLQTNYRSTASITDPASALIANNGNRLNESINPHSSDGLPIKVSVHIDREDEAQEICKKIRALASSGVSMKRMAILFRINSQSRAFEMWLRNFSIPYKLTGAFKFLDREEVKDVLSMLKFAVNNVDSISFSRFANKPKRGLGASAVSTLAPRLIPGNIKAIISRVEADSAFPPKQRDALVSVLSAFEGLYPSSNPGEAAELLVQRLGYKRYLETSTKEKHKSEEKIDNVDELIKYAHSFFEQGKGSLRDFCASLSLSDDDRDEKTDQSVNLMSMHASKGLEFDTVFVVGCEEGSIPHERSIKENSLAKIEEERRLMYVAMTRAEKRLSMTMSLFDGKSRDKVGRVSIKRYSRFLQEAGLMDAEAFSEKVAEIRACLDE